MSIVKVIELLAQSDKSWEDAVQNAIWEASKTIKGITGVEILNMTANIEEGKISEDDILPSMNLVYRLNEEMNIRAAYTKTLARPTFREIAPFSSKEFVNASISILCSVSSIRFIQKNNKFAKNYVSLFSIFDAFLLSENSAYLFSGNKAIR